VNKKITGSCAKLSNYVVNNIDYSPRISIVTPSYNHGEFIEETICSVISQNYPNLEYIIIDGDSSDNTVDVIKKYRGSLSYAISEPDDGLYHALNKGFAESSGEIMGWINSDDKHLPWTLQLVAEIFSTLPSVEWLTTAYPIWFDKRGVPVGCSYYVGFNRHAFFRGTNLPGRKWFSRPTIQQESTFWRRTLWERSGGYIDSSLKLAGDYELWARFFTYADLLTTTVPLAGFRHHGNQKSVIQIEEYMIEAEKVLRRYGGKPYGAIQSMLRKYISYGFGVRPLGSLSPFIKQMLIDLKFIYPVRLVTWQGKWNIDKSYML